MESDSHTKSRRESIESLSGSARLCPRGNKPIDCLSQEGQVHKLSVQGVQLSEVSAVQESALVGLRHLPQGSKAVNVCPRVFFLD